MNDSPITSDASASDYVAHLQFSHGRGARCWTLDGREYLDLVCGEGPIVLGHAHPAVTAAVVRQLEKGTMLPGPAPAFRELRDLLIGLYPHNEDLLTFKTGSEAVAAAIRLARAFTKRSVILRVGYLGWHDQVISPYVRCHSYDSTTFQTAWPLGVPHETHSNLINVWHGQDPQDLLAIVRSTATDLAAVIIDPVQLAPPGACDAARSLAQAIRSAGSVLIFDESKTGFRVHLGGVQALYGVNADLTILSKALANGLPLAVVLGRAELIRLAKTARIKGTFGSETAAIAAALATIDILRLEDAPRVLNERGKQLLDGLNVAIRSAGLHPDVVAVPYHWPCLPYVHFSGNARTLQHAFHDGLVKRGVLMLRDHMSYVSLSLTSADVESIVVAAHDVLADLVRQE